MGRELRFAELDGGEVVECNPPDGRMALRTEEFPVQEPQAGSILQVGIPAIVTEEPRPEHTRDCERHPRPFWIGFLLEDLEREPPVADRVDHVLADPELHCCLIVGENVTSIC